MNECKLVTTSIDIMNVGSTATVGTFKEFDNVIIRISMLNRKEPCDLTGKKIKIFARKPNGSIVYQESDITVVNPRGGIIDVKLKNGLLNTTGSTSFEIEIINTDGSFVTSGAISYSIMDKLNDLDNEIEEVDDIEFLHQAKEFNDYIVPEEIKRVESESARLRNEVLRIQSEEFRVLDEETRKANEIDRQARIAVIENKVDTVISQQDIDTIIANALK